MKKKLLSRLVPFALALVLMAVLLPMRAEAAPADDFSLVITNFKKGDDPIYNFGVYGLTLIVREPDPETNPGVYSFTYYCTITNNSNQNETVVLQGGNEPGSGTFTWNDCTDSANIVQTHSRYGYSWTVTLTNNAQASHTLTEVTIAPTCTSEGVNKSVCRNCTQIASSTPIAVDANAHKFGAWTSNGDGTHTRVCQYNAAHTQNGTCSGGVEVCGERKICETCNAAYGDTIAHNYSTEWVPITGPYFNIGHSKPCLRCGVALQGSFEPTCTYTGGSCTEAPTCEKCGRSSGQTLPHDTYTEVSATSANCMLEKCRNCNHEAQAELKIKDGPLVYTGNPIEGAYLDYSGNWSGEKNVPIIYSNNVDAGDDAFAGLTAGSGLNFTIAPALLDDAVVTLSPSTFTYDGTAKKPSHTVTLAGFDTLVEGRDYVAGYLGARTIVNGVPTNWFGKPAEAPLNGECINVSIYGVFIRGVEGGNFQVSESKEEMGVYGTFTIEKGEPAVTAPTAKENLTYTGQPLTLAEPGSTAVGEMYYNVSEDGNGTWSKDIPTGENAGTYKLWYKAVVPGDNKNFTSSTPASIDVTIAKRAPDYAAPTPKRDLVYDGTPKMLIDAGMSEHGTFQYSLTGKDGEWSRDIPTAIDGGNYTVYWKLVGDGNHSDVAGLAPVPVTIGRCQIPLTTADFTFTPPAELTYSGTPKAAKVEARGKTGVGDITVKYDKDPVNAGTYKVSIDVAAGANYEAATGLTHDSWVFTINKATPVIDWDTTVFTYNGAPQGEVKVELVGSDTYTGKIQYSFDPDENIGREGLPVHAGTYVVYASTETLDNYAPAVEKETIRIDPKEVTPMVVIEPEYFTYDGTVKTPAVKVMDGETEIPAKEYSVDGNNTDVGAAIVTVSDAAGGNYTVRTIGTVYLILPDASALEGVTTENVNSSHQAAIDAIQDAMDGKNIAAASDDARAQWNALAARCSDLENAISNAAAKRAEITDAVSELPQQPKTSDLEEIDAILDQYEEIEDNLTTAEKNALAEDIAELEDLKAAITDANADLKEITDGAAALDEDELVFADKATIQDLLEQAEALEDNAYLTDTQKQTLADAEEQLADLEDAFAAAEKVEADYLNKLPATVKPGTKESVDAYEAAKKAYNDLGTAGKAKVDPQAVKKLEDFKAALTDYEITKGADGKWVKGSSSGLSFTANGYYPHFKGVEIDGKLIDDDYYTDKAGSTIVTLKAGYLQKLKTGKHTVSILFGDGDYEGEATATFRVKASSTSPDTGDGIMAAVAVMVLSTAALVCLIAWKRKRRA